jgi:MFS transporter, DHA1 family, tetracycline resistance protein
MLLGLSVSLILIYVAAHAIQSNWSFFTMEKFKWSKEMVGYSLGVVGVLIAVVQGGLVRVINPRLGQVKSVYVGLLLQVLGFFLFAFAGQSWMMFAFLIPYCMGGIAQPGLQSIIAGQVPNNQQGELQGILTSLMSATAIIGPPLMTNLFAYFTAKDAPVYFPGAPFILGGLLTLLAVFWSIRTLSTYSAKKQQVAEKESEPA